MKCAICRNGITERGYTTVIFEKDEMTLVFKRVPAQICNNCGEEYISSEVNKTLLRCAREEMKRGITLEMLTYANAA
jgi:YgiT-type zinc finger domain-containing protein